MASKKKIARIEARAAKANASPPKEDWPLCDHRPDPDYDGYCWCGKTRDHAPA